MGTDTGTGWGTDTTVSVGEYGYGFGGPEGYGADLVDGVTGAGKKKEEVGPEELFVDKAEGVKSETAKWFGDIGGPSSSSRGNGLELG